MRKKIHTFSIITFTFSLAAAQAAVVQRWTVETSRVQPVVFDAVRGETLSLEASFQSYGKAVAIPTNGWCILWQTNGMGSAWWSAGASCEREVKEEGQGQQWNGSSSSALYPLSSTNYVVKATFTPAMDPGADTVIGFLGATGQNYRASFRLRFRHGPGERPNTLAAPVPILDLAHTTVINPPWPTEAELKAYIDGEIEGAVGIDAATAWTIATNAITNVVTKSFVEGLGITASGGGGLSESEVNAIIASSNLCNETELQTTALAVIDLTTNAAVGQAAADAATKYLPKERFEYGSGSLSMVYGAEYAKYAQTALYISMVTKLDNSSTACPFRRKLAFGAQDGYQENGGRTYLMNKVGNDWEIAETTAWLSDIESKLSEYVPNTRKVNGQPLTSDITIEGMTGNALVLTNNSVKTKSGTAITAAQVGAADASTVYTKSQSDAIFYPKTSGDAWAAFWDGDEVRVTVTNYYGQSDLPHLYLEQRTNETGTAKYKTVWDEHTRWRKFVGGDFNWNAWGGFHGFKTNATARLDELEANKADRAWGFYDSSTGDYAPANYTSVSSSNLMIAAGLAYQRTVTTSGCAVWVLTATEPTTINGTTNGAFQVKDADGNVQVEIVKGDKRTVGARCGGVSVSGAALVANYAVASAEHPTLEVCTDLATAAWKAEDAANCPATVAWSGTSGAWTATVTPSAGASAVFVKASYQVGGDTIFKSNVPVKFSQIIIGTTKYNIGTATVSGSTVLTLTPTL